MGVTETWEQKDANNSCEDQNNDDLDDNLVGENSTTTQETISETEIDTKTLTEFAKVSGAKKVDSSVKKKRKMTHTDKTSEETLTELKKRQMLQ